MAKCYASKTVDRFRIEAWIEDSGKTMVSSAAQGQSGVTYHVRVRNPRGHPKDIKITADVPIGDQFSRFQPPGKTPATLWTPPAFLGVQYGTPGYDKSDIKIEQIGQGTTRFRVVDMAMPDRFGSNTVKRIRMNVDLPVT
jgi:hypothetical protein